MNRKGALPLLLLFASSFAVTFALFAAGLNATYWKPTICAFSVASSKPTGWDFFIKKSFADSVISINYDFSDLPAFVGRTDNIFVGKVTEKVGTEFLYDAKNPFTVFKIEPIYNVKGNLKESILLKQEGAESNGVVEVLDYRGMRKYPIEESCILKPGHTYLLFARASRTDSTFFLPYAKEFREELSSSKWKSSEGLRDVALRSRRVHALLRAYVNEVPQRSNIMNRFDLLSKDERQAVLDKFSELIPQQNIPIVVHPDPYDFSPPPIENSISSCRDELDNDRDGLPDYHDPECASFYKEVTRNQCRDKGDNDVDNLIDADDPDCAEFYPPIAVPVNYFLEGKSFLELTAPIVHSSTNTRVEFRKNDFYGEGSNLAADVYINGIKASGQDGRISAQGISDIRFNPEVKYVSLIARTHSGAETHDFQVYVLDIRNRKILIPSPYFKHSKCCKGIENEFQVVDRLAWHSSSTLEVFYYVAKAGQNKDFVRVSEIESYMFNWPTTTSTPQ